MMHDIYVFGSTLRVMLEPLFLLLSDEGLRVQSMTQTLGWDTVDAVWNRV